MPRKGEKVSAETKQKMIDSQRRRAEERRQGLDPEFDLPEDPNDAPPLSTGKGTATGYFYRGWAATNASRTFGIIAPDIKTLRELWKKHGLEPLDENLCYRVTWFSDDDTREE